MAQSLEEAMRAAGIEPVVNVADVTDTNGAGFEVPPVAEDKLEPPAFLKKHKAPQVPVQPLAQQETFAEDQPAPQEARVVNTPVPALPPQVEPPAAPQEPQEEEDPQEEEGGSNQPNPNADRRAVMREIGRLGEAEAAGQNARPAFFEKVSEASRLGAVTEADAAALHEVYTKGIAKARGVGHVKMGSEPQQVSKIKTMIKFGALPSIRPDSVLADVRAHMAARRAANSPVKKSPADAYLTAARMQLGQPQFQLTEQQIEEALAVKVPAQKIEADLLYQFVDGMDKKLADDNITFTDESVAIMEAFIGVAQNRIKELGGTTKQQKEAAKLAEKEAKLNAAKEKAANVIRRK